MRVAAVLEEPPGYTGPADWESWPLQRPLADFVLDPDAPILPGQESAECQWKGLAFYECFSELTCQEWLDAHSSTPPPSCRDEWVAYFDQDPCAEQGDP